MCEYSTWAHNNSQASADKSVIEGGRIAAAGTPEGVAETKGSFTGEYLAAHLKPKRKKRAPKKKVA